MCQTDLVRVDPVSSLMPRLFSLVLIIFLRNISFNCQEFLKWFLTQIISYIRHDLVKNILQKIVYMCFGDRSKNDKSEEEYIFLPYVPAVWYNAMCTVHFVHFVKNSTNLIFQWTE